MAIIVIPDRIIVSAAKNSELGAERDFRRVKASLLVRLETRGGSREVEVLRRIYSASYSLNPGLDPANYDFRNFTVSGANWANVVSKTPARRVRIGDYARCLYVEEWLRLTEEQKGLLG